MTTRTVACLFFLVCGVGGCGSVEHRVGASEFRRGCSVASDCVAIYEGALGCCGASCPNAAINGSSLPAYQSAVSSRTPACNPAPPCAFIPPETCPGHVSCVSGTCTFEQLEAEIVPRR